MWKTLGLQTKKVGKTVGRVQWNNLVEAWKAAMLRVIQNMEVSETNNITNELKTILVIF